MSKFVVTETNFEYNDEVHCIADGGAGIPVAVFDTLQEAKMYAMDRTVNDFLRGWAGDQLYAFGYGLDEVFSKMPPCFEAETDEDQFWDSDGYDIIDNMNIPKLDDIKLREIASCLSFEPYKVTEVK